MNLEITSLPSPLRVIVVNPLVPAAQLIAVKILSGTVFGTNQLIDLTLLVYSNELQMAEAFILELENCAFSCVNSMHTSSNLPSITDADVFCFITNFPNPNCIDFYNVITDEMFDSFYLIIKIANNLFGPISNIAEIVKENVINKKNIKSEQKPIFIADGLVAIDILKSLSTNVPYDVFFCPTPLTSIGKNILGEYLKVETDEINDLLVWAANDSVFHVEVEKPLVIQDTISGDNCDWNLVGKDVLRKTNLDHTQFNESWLKKDFIEKMESFASRNPYGCIYKASQISKTLQDIWASRSTECELKSYCSMGVISDESLGTIKGHPYVLPLIFSGDHWCVNERFKENTHLKMEIKRINKVAQEQHEKLITYCKHFLQENVLNQAFIPNDESSASITIDRLSRFSE
ncbi:malate dehydrogenase, cytoplasmic isoform X1 [Bombyx mori]|uniref:Malate dehydrogenase n=2 Tax=Bombyx mori TaxID=7091 RepID=A0A8R2LWI1_BOMMO|nr:malate dehydrogenase, cytoplasmic-like isoform X1 [Bombyx mori]